MSNFYRNFPQGMLIAGYVIFSAPSAWAASFTIDSGETVTATQTLSVDGDTGLIISGGIIDTSGTNGRRAVSVAADNVDVTNNGSISCKRSVDCISINGNRTNVTVINNGSITASGTQGDGVAQNNGSNFIFINNGSISTSGTAGETVINFGDNGSITNNGTLTTTGAVQNVFTEGDGDQVTNNGIITASANNASAIVVGFNGGSGIGSTITNNNTIRVTGSGSTGILMVNASGTTINNSGLISAEQSATAAIDGSNNSETLNLLSGSQIIGTIDLDDGTDTVNISGANNSSTLTLTDTEVIRLVNDNGLIVGTVATVVDPTGQSISSAVLSNTTLAIHNNVNQRLAHHKPLKPIQVATLELSPGMVFQERAPQIWGSAIGVRRTRGREGIALGYDHNYVGFTGGYELSFRKARMGLLGGFVKSRVKTKGDAFGRLRSIDTDSDGFFAGAYSQYFLGKINLTTTLMAGYEDHNNDRAVVDNLNGFETAQADFGSFFVSPSFTLSSAYILNKNFELRPAATLAYSGGWYEDYAESGTTRSDLVVDDRDTHSLTGQLQLATAYTPYENSELELRMGAKVRYTDDSDISLSLAGTDFRVPNASDNSVYGCYIGMNLRIAFIDKINLIANLEQGIANGNESQTTAMLKIEGMF